MQILVTGAGGYVGIPATIELLSRGHHVIGLDRYYFGREKLGRIAENPCFTLKVDDIRYFDLALLSDVDAIIDLAGFSNDLSAAMNPVLTRQINVEGCERVARAAKRHGVRRYVFASSASVYGAGEKKGLNERDECRPLTEYARSKLAVECVLKELNSHCFETVVLRPATIFGLAPRMRFDLALNLMTMQAWSKREIIVTGGGKQWRPFIHVNDVVQAVMLGLESPAPLVAGETFNVGDDDMNFQIERVAQLVCDVIPDAKVRHLPGAADCRTYNLSFDKVSRRLGFRAATPVHQGVHEIEQALERNRISSHDPTTVTLGWYQSLMDWEKRIGDLRLNGQVF